MSVPQTLFLIKLHLVVICHFITDVYVWNSEIAAITTAGSKRCIAVSTVREAEAFVDEDYDDILFAAHFGPDKIPRYVKL